MTVLLLWSSYYSGRAAWSRRSSQCRAPRFPLPLDGRHRILVLDRGKIASQMPELAATPLEPRAACVTVHPLKTEAFERSCRDRKRVQMLFAP